MNSWVFEPAETAETALSRTPPHRAGSTDTVQGAAAVKTGAGVGAGGRTGTEGRAVMGSLSWSSSGRLQRSGRTSSLEPEM